MQEGFAAAKEAATMQNAHSRMGNLHFLKRSKDTTTSIRVHMDRFIGEPVNVGQQKAHLVSVFGGDSEIGAIWAGVVEGAAFNVEGPGLTRVTVALGSDAHCFRGTMTVPGKKRPVRHLIAVSEEFALTRLGAGQEGKRTILCDGDSGFVLYRLAKRFGLPVVPEWRDWFVERMKRTNVVRPLLGLGCTPVVVWGGKKLFVKWIAEGLRSGQLRIPETSGPVTWARGMKFFET